MTIEVEKKIKYINGNLHFENEKEREEIEKEIKKMSDYAKKKKKILEKMLGDDFSVSLNLMIIPKENIKGILNGRHNET